MDTKTNKQKVWVKAVIYYNDGVMVNKIFSLNPMNLDDEISKRIDSFIKKDGYEGVSIYLIDFNTENLILNVKEEEIKNIYLKGLVEYFKNK